MKTVTLTTEQLMLACDAIQSTIDDVSYRMKKYPDDFDIDPDDPDDPNLKNLLGRMDGYQQVLALLSE